MPSWEIGRVGSGFGAKAGGLGSVIQELPEELVKAASARDIRLEIEILTPCFGHYDRSKLDLDPLPVKVNLDKNVFDFSVYRRAVDENISIVYFWDDKQLGWTNNQSLYPEDPEMGFKLYATVSQAMAGYIKRNRFNSVHGHDYHVGIIPFYLGREYLQKIPFHLTIHNATYQGIFAAGHDGPAEIDRIGLPGNELYDRYFNLNNSINFLRATVLFTHETGGKITTVSGDLQASWGYASELLMNHDDVIARALELNPEKKPGEVFVPNCGLDAFQETGVLGITNGLASFNRAENIPELQAQVLREIKKAQGGRNLFNNSSVEKILLQKDHNFTPAKLKTKEELKKLLHMELFNSEPDGDLVILSAVGRLVSQKNFEIIASTAERILKSFPSVKYAILATPPGGDRNAQGLRNEFKRLSKSYPESFFYGDEFSQPLSRLILAGSDFALIPSRFEPCGLVDYEACALGTIVIGRKTGGLSKVECCSYLYEWLDIGDRYGEEEAFYRVIEEAVNTKLLTPARHNKLARSAMTLDSGWEKSASLYIDLYLYGLLLRAWHSRKNTILKQVDRYAEALFEKYPFFPDFYRINSEDLLEKRMEQAVSKQIK